MSQDFVQSQLDAGGLVAVNSTCDAKTTEKIVARSYGAPVLGARVVVKLSSDRLVPAEDLAMEFLGLEGRSVSTPIALQTRTSLDFAHWALIHQPKHAKYALDLVKRMKATARKAASKPGAAWDLYAEMADDLNKSVRDLLPPYWEQVARTFKNIGNQTYAGRGLNKALEAERVHALKVDREHRRDAVLEFALSGCLSGKALTDYAKDLEKQFTAADAYETFKDLVIRRTLGGMPPIANAASDLNRMAKAAKLDVVAEIESVLESIISSPAMSRAPIQFWKSVKQSVATIVKRNDSFAAWLLVHTKPQSSYRADSAVWQWLDLLDEWGVLSMLSQPLDQWPQDVELPGGRAGWIGAIASVESSPNKRVFELLEQMANVLRAEAKPISLSVGWNGRIVDVDVLEACLDLGLEVSLAEFFNLDFDGWLRAEVDHPRRNSQLEKITGEPRYMSALRGKIPELVSFGGDSTSQLATWGRQISPRRSFEDAAVAHPMIRDAWWNYLERQLIALESGGLVDIEKASNRLINCLRPKAFAEFPELAARLQKVDITASLHRTLIAGLLDEYGWPELDKVADAKALPVSKGRQEPAIFTMFPRLTYVQNGFVHIVDVESTAKPVELKLKATETVNFAAAVGDDVMIAVTNTSDGWETTMRWTSEQDKVFKHTDSYFYAPSGEMAIVPVGVDGFFCGSQVICPGDQFWPRTNHRTWFHDGERFWCLKENAAHWQNVSDPQVSKPMLAELDPKSGKELRDSVPPLFEESMPAGGQVHWQACDLLPLPNQSGESPLGSKNGLIGWRVVRRRDGAIESLGIDGRKWVFEADQQPPNGYRFASAMIDKPGTRSFWILTSEGELMDAESGIAFGYFGQQQGQQKFAVGQPTILSKKFLHLMRLRCSATSHALRSLTLEKAKEVFNAGQIQYEALKLKADPAKPDPARTAGFEAVKKQFPQAPPRLLDGIARITRIAVDEAASLKSILTRALPKDSDKIAAPVFDPQRADAGFKSFVMNDRSVSNLYSRFGLHRHSFMNDEYSVSTNMVAVGNFLRGEACDELPRCATCWVELLFNLPSRVWECFWKIATDESTNQKVADRLNTPWLDSLTCLAESKLLGLKEKLFVYRATEVNDQDKKQGSVASRLGNDQPVAFVEGDNRFVAFQIVDYPSNQIVILGYSPNGKAKPPKEFNVAIAEEVDSGWNRLNLLSFVKGARAVQALPLPTPEQLATASAKLGVHPIGVALTWMGELRTVGYGQEKLTKELRDFYGWKVKEIQAAVADINAAEIPPTLSATGVRNNPGGAMLDGRDRAFEQMVQQWAAAQKKMIQLPAELTKKLEFGRTYHQPFPVKLITDLLSYPKESEIVVRRKATLGPINNTLPRHTSVFNAIVSNYEPKLNLDFRSTLPGVLRSLAVINYELPVGAEARLAIPAVIDELRSFLDDPTTALGFGASLTTENFNAVDVAATVATISSAIGKLELDTDGHYRCDTGLIVVATVPPSIALLFRPSQLVDDKAIAKLLAAANVTNDYGGTGANHMQCATFVMKIRNAATTQLADDNRNISLPLGSWEQDPRLSAPETVQACMKQLNVSEPAATLYLQVLALHDPTTANIKRWNQWPTKELAAASAELVAGEYVVVAKRERAGREIFLPGGWEPLKQPNLPIETWKLSMFGHHDTERLRGGSAAAIVCEGSIGGAFRIAWKRVTAGDSPRYQDAITKKKKK